MPTRRMLYDARGITPKPCGVRNVAENYLKELSQHYSVVAMVNRETEHLVDPAIPREIAPRHCSRFGLLSDFWVSRQVLKHKPDIFFSAHSFLPPFALLPGVKVFICHDLFAALDKDFFAKRGLLAPLARMLFRALSEISFYRASVVIAPSQAIAETFKALFIRARRVVVIYNGVSFRALPQRARENRILFVGNFRSYKGFDVLYDAWRQAQSDVSASKWFLDVVTNEPSKSIDKFIKENGAVSRIYFHSRISNDALDDMRSRARITVVPSRQEGFGIPLLEAVVAGGNVIYSDIPVFRELVEDLQDGAVASFPSEDTRKLAHTILSVIQNDIAPNLKAREDLPSRYSWANAAARFSQELK